MLQLELFPILPSELKIGIQSSISKKIRGSNFSKDAVIFVDNTKNIYWLWKKLGLNFLLREYIVSVLADELGIRVPKSVIARNGGSIGLLQEWIPKSIDLYSFSFSQPAMINKSEIIDLMVFQALVGAADQHGGNFLYKDGTVWGIDFENCFQKENHRNELCLYFPWIRSSTIEIKDSVIKLKTEIVNKQLIERVTSIAETIKIPLDPRARVAVKNQLKQIKSFLEENLEQFENVTKTYLQNCFSQPKFLTFHLS
ncbi:MAG: hypothetical protein ACXAC8_06705 [Candidatus Hodarchaeales archaeon]|jgi:hypothetical protein